ncbi:hypothetical protein ACTXT7_014296 [Hymenolepis weldensis]
MCSFIPYHIYSKIPGDMFSYDFVITYFWINHPRVSRGVYYQVLNQNRTFFLTKRLPQISTELLMQKLALRV